LKFELWNKNCLINKKNLIIKDVGVFEKKENEDLSNEECRWIISSILGKDVNLLNVRYGFFDHCFKKKISSVIINKTIIIEKNGYIEIKENGEEPLILYNIYKAYETLNDFFLGGVLRFKTWKKHF